MKIYLPQRITLGLVVAAIALLGCSAALTTSTGAAHLGQRTKTAGCQAKGALADPDCTPGGVLPDATKDLVCQPGYARNVRNVPEAEKTDAYDEYDVRTHAPGQYEVDHLVSLELGGSNEIANLWPEPASPRPGFHEKDQVENYLHDQVCSGAVPLARAQEQIATNWLDLYNRMPKTR